MVTVSRFTLHDAELGQASGSSMGIRWNIVDREARLKDGPPFGLRKIELKQKYPIGAGRELLADLLFEYFIKVLISTES
ncbi:hypothetical protein ACM61V_15575 [Sphingomonas sp. TX0543]|uniref:hypothetical protein n=1 Tax=Sphingomonas sp. TX0543 TaxID=3399682 RepID=UPI003AFA8420